MHSLGRLLKLRSFGLVLSLVLLIVACTPAAPNQAPKSETSPIVSATRAPGGTEPSPSTATNPGAATKKTDGEPIKVGLLLTNVGPSALFARYEDKGARLLIDQVNKTGGINGRPIELVPYDTEGKPDRAASLFRRLVNEDKVAAVIGPDSILVTLGMSGVPKETKTLSVTSAGNYELIKAEDREYLVTAVNGYSMALALGYFKNKLNVKRIGLVTTADVVGESNDRLIRDVAQMVGIEVARTVAQPSTDRDLLPSLRELAAIKPAIDGLYVFGSGPYGNIAINQTEMVGLNVPIGYMGGNIIPELIKDVGPSVAKNVYIVQSRLAALDTLPKDDPYLPVMKRFREDYQAFHGEDPSLPSGWGYDMALPIVEALKAVGPDREKIKDYVLTQQELTGRQGVKFRRTAGDIMGIDPLDVVVVGIENGKFVFRDYLKPSFDALKIGESRIKEQMRALHFLTK